MQLILASQSPRRLELMGMLNIPFTVHAADIDEAMDPAQSPLMEVPRVSLRKAQAIPRREGDIVVAADTVVYCGGRMLGKPHSRQEAAEMLRLLSGRSHQVITGLTVLTDEAVRSEAEVTEVFFRPLTDREIESYIGSGEPMDKAGAYGIQGRGALFVEKISGDYYNVMGLPLCRLWQTLWETAPAFMEEWQ